MNTYLCELAVSSSAVKTHAALNGAYHSTEELFPFKSTKCTIYFLGSLKHIRWIMHQIHDQ